MNATLSRPSAVGLADISQQEVMLLLVGAVEDNDSKSASFFSHSTWQARRVPGCREALPLIRLGLHGVIVVERDLPDGNWKDVLEFASFRNKPPLVIVTSRLADDYLWAEVLNLGGYDVLAKPFIRDEVNRTINLAWQRWKNQGEAVSNARKAGK
jgi:DNA-binding response OmpR family regulator